MKFVQFLTAALLLVASPVVLADKPDPELPNPPIQVWIAGGEVLEADVNVTNTPVRIPWSITQSHVVVSGDPYFYVASFMRYPDDFPDDTGILVIETFSYDVELPTTGEQVSVKLTAQGGPMGVFQLNMPQTTGININGNVLYRDTASFRAYAGGEGLGFIGDSLLVQFLMTAEIVGAEFSWSVSGYFVPEDSPSLAP